MRTFLVAICAESQDDVMEFLQASPFGPDKGEDTGPHIDCWWIAEDDREDGSDLDSAVFVARGAQTDMYNLLSEHWTANESKWDREGYPYAETDESGRYLPPAIRETNRMQDEGQDIWKSNPEWQEKLAFLLEPSGAGWRYQVEFTSGEEISSGWVANPMLAWLRVRGVMNCPWMHADLSSIIK